MVSQIRTGKRRAAALGALLIGALAVGPAAFADDEYQPDGMDTWWDGETLNVPWDGSDEYQTIPGDKFLHNAVAVPGDWVHRTLVVQNNGPCPGSLTVELRNPAATSQDSTVNDDDPSVTAGRIGFAGMSELHWDVGGSIGSDSFAALVDQQVLGTARLAQGASVDVQMAYKFPYDETEGKHLGFPSQVLEWDLGLRLKGECDWKMSTPPAATPPGLPFSGANILFAAISAAFLVAAGVTAVWGAGRRRRQSARP
ncbi:MAG: hypothetical protein LBG60_07005 [Bifidobacteriaceae bacterium]|jgi:hypothetical protein|nr:hypothetical protein [Bifidobacteriaceae bacterium]